MSSQRKTAVISKKLVNGASPQGISDPEEGEKKNALLSSLDMLFNWQLVYAYLNLTHGVSLHPPSPFIVPVLAEDKTTTCVKYVVFTLW